MKILISMLFVVLTLTGSSLYVSHQRMQRIYDQMIEEVFLNQLQNYYAKQDIRNSFVKSQAERLTNSVRLFAALEEGEGELVYQTAHDELRDFRSEFKFFRVLDKTGFPIYDGSHVSGMNQTQFETQLDAQLEKFAPHFRVSQQKQLNGYIHYEDTSGRPWLFELVITKIYNFEGTQVIGALVLGFNADLDMLSGGQKLIQSGLVMDGILYTKVIPALMQKDVLDLLLSQGTLPSQLALSRVLIQSQPYRVRLASLNTSSGFLPVYQLTLFSLAKFEEQQGRLRNSILMVGGIGTLLALLLCLYLANGLVKPVLALLKGTRKVIDGDYDVSIPVTNRDEIGELSESFNTMTKGLVLKEKYHNVLQAVTDKSVAEQLTQGDLKLGGELRRVSILFCDIRGFTALTEGMPPGDVIQLLNEHMTILTNAVNRHNGIVDKFVGDLIMAIFGAPHSYEQDALNAVKCALEMRRERRDLNQSSRYKIEIGTGIATGDVVAGCMGSDKRLNYTVLGEYVNLASRLCSQAAAGEILIDENTQSELSEKISVRIKDKLFLKGFSSPVQAYSLTDDDKE